MSKTSHRHLKAILFIDIVGYTAMMQRDEREGLAALQRFREVIEDSVEFYNGKVVNH